MEYLPVWAFWSAVVTGVMILVFLVVIPYLRYDPGPDDDSDDGLLDAITDERTNHDR